MRAPFSARWLAVALAVVSIAPVDGVPARVAKASGTRLVHYPVARASRPVQASARRATGAKMPALPGTVGADETPALPGSRTETSGTLGSRNGPPPFPYAVRGVTRVAQLIGPTPDSPGAPFAASPRSINDTMRWGVCGGDLGSLIDAGGVAYIMLGDNYTSCPPGTGGPGGELTSPDWRSNAVGVISDPGNFTRGLHITRWISRDGRHAAEVIPSQHNAGDCQDTQAPGCEVTRIPTYGFATQGRLFLAFMSVHHWGVPATWDVNYSSFAASANGGKTWTVETRRIRWGPHSNFAQVAVAPDPSGRYLLFYGIPGGRFGAVKLMRTLNTWRGVLTARDYEYYTGTDAVGQPAWSRDPARAAVVADAPVGELSVIYDPGLKQWLMTYLQGGNDQVLPSSGNLVIRAAPHYWGPWSQPATLVSQQQYPGLYGAFMNPRFLSDHGRTIYFDMSQWGPYSVFWMKASLTARR